MRPTPLIHKLEEMQRALADRHIGSLVVYGVTFFTFGLGAVMLASPDTFTAAPTFEHVFSNPAPGPQVWGILFCFTAFVTGVGYFGTKEHGRPGALGLILMYSIFAALASINPFQGQGVLSATIVYSAMAWFSLITLICCTTPRKEPHATP